MSESRINIAIQKSGRLTEHSTTLLQKCGLIISQTKDQLIGYGENMPIDLMFVRDDDIPDLIQENLCSLGIVGQNVALEKKGSRALKPLKFFMALHYTRIQIYRLLK